MDNRLQDFRTWIDATDLWWCGESRPAQADAGEVFLGQMDVVVPWRALLSLIEPHYPNSGRGGRQPYALETVLRIHFLKQRYALTDPAIEEALYDTVVMFQTVRL